MAGPEIWKLIPGYDNRYEASSEGHIRRNVNAHWRKRVWRDGLLKVHVDKTGYVRARIMRDERHSYNVGVHQLVAAAFLGLCPPGHEVNHIDRNKANNCPENLEYVTHAENLEHARQKGAWARSTRHGEQAAPAKLTERQVTEIRSLLADGLSHCRIADMFGVSQPTITNIKTGKTWAHLPQQHVQLPLFEEET
jgi:HNH endonuclease/NUMOD4 motif-containing protein